MGSESIEMRVMRMMAWERAKGELNSMLPTYQDENEKDDRFDRFDNALDSFVKEVEESGLAE